jgi:hypothetical protein
MKEVYEDPTHVFLNKPKDLQLVRAGKNGEMAFVFHHDKAAHQFNSKINGLGTILDDSTNHSRTVFVGPARS